jgi:hypothetical protein
MPGSFRSNSFEERGQGGQTFDVWGRSADVSVTHIPGGNTTVIQSAGLNADRLNLRIKCTKAQLDALRNVVGTSGSLVIAYGTRNAFLEAIADVQEIYVHEEYFATLAFIGQ